MSDINIILADSAVSVSDFKKNPMAVVKGGEGFPVAILNRNKPAFYCVPAEAWEILLGKLEDIELAKLAKERMDDCYKIKLRQAGHRLVYQVKDKKLVVLVLAVGKTERNAVYKSAIERI